MYLASFMEMKNFTINCARCVEAIAELTKTPQSGSQKFLQNNTSQNKNGDNNDDKVSDKDKFKVANL